MKEIKDLKRKLWAIEAVLIHHLNVDLVKPIYERYCRIDCVPTNFNFIEFMEFKTPVLKRPYFP